MYSISFKILLLLSVVANNQKVLSNETVELENHLYKLIRAEGDPTTDKPSDKSDNDLPLTNSTTAEACISSGNCCAMFTWPGNDYLVDRATAPRSCQDLRKILDDDDDEIACFDPIIYSDSNHSIRPDPRLVTERCVSDSLACFCTPTSACIKLTFRLNNEAQEIVNETRFCGTLTNVLSGQPVTTGCYNEKIAGTPHIREVCACEASGDAYYCNSSHASSLLIPSFFFTLVLTLLTFTPIAVPFIRILIGSC